MVSMAVASASIRPLARSEVRRALVVPEIQMWMEWIQEWIFYLKMAIDIVDFPIKNGDFMVV